MRISNEIGRQLFFYLFFFFFLFSISLSLSSYFLLSLSVLLFLRPFLFLLSAFLISLCPSLSFFSPRFSSLSLFFFFFLIQNVGSEINFLFLFSVAFFFPYERIHCPGWNMRFHPLWLDRFLYLRFFRLSFLLVSFLMLMGVNPGVAALVYSLIIK